MSKASEKKYFCFFDLLRFVTNYALWQKMLPVRNSLTETKIVFPPLSEMAKIKLTLLIDSHKRYNMNFYINSCQFLATNLNKVLLLIFKSYNAFIEEVFHS